MKPSTTSLLEALIICAIIAAAGKLLADGKFRFHLIINHECDNNEDILSEDTTNSTRTSNDSPSSMLRPTSTIVPVNIRGYKGIKMEDMVEVYDPTVLKSTTFFGRIVSVKLFSSSHNYVNVEDDDSSFTVKFDIIAGPTHSEIFYDVDSTKIRAAVDSSEPYEFNTRAICDYGHSLRGNRGLFPCTILTRSESSDVPTYWVLGSMKNDGQKLKPMEMPLSRVRPLVDPQAAREELKLDVLNFPDPTTRHDINDADAPKNNIILEGMVNIYGVDGVAQPGIITGYQEEESVYSVQMTAIHQHMAEVETDLVHSYEIYPDGTSAICNVAEFPRIEPMPCTVISHSIMDDESNGGLLVYQVMHERGAGDASLPFSRIWRHI